VFRNTHQQSFTSFESLVFLPTVNVILEIDIPKVVITINKSLFTLSIVAGFLSLSGVSASANTPKVASSDTLAAIAAKNHAALDGSVFEQSNQPTKSFNQAWPTASN